MPIGRSKYFICRVIAKGTWEFSITRNRVLFGGDAIQGSVYLDVTGKPALCPTYLYPESYLQTCQLIEHLDIDYYVSCHWPIKTRPRDCGILRRNPGLRRAGGVCC